MDIMKKYGVSVPTGDIAITPEQARDLAEKFGTFDCSELSYKYFTERGSNYIVTFDTKECYCG